MGWRWCLQGCAISGIDGLAELFTGPTSTQFLPKQLKPGGVLALTHSLSANDALADPNRSSTAIAVRVLVFMAIFSGNRPLIRSAIGCGSHDAVNVNRHWSIADRQGALCCL
jgi:hypothetical protein